MKKQVVQDWMDAETRVKETEKRIHRLEAKKKETAQICVSGSNSEFPYQKRHFTIEGPAFTWQDDSRVLQLESLLQEQKQTARYKRLCVLEEMNSAPIRIQRLVNLRYIHKLSWAEVVKQIGRGATVDSVRAELKRYFDSQE